MPRLSRQAVPEVVRWAMSGVHWNREGERCQRWMYATKAKKKTTDERAEEISVETPEADAAEQNRTTREDGPSRA